ncbi:MAG: hypothetical protein ACE14M_05070 [Terriglobales bacterium]
MFNSEHIEVQSIEELILAVQPVDVDAIQSGERDAVYAELRRMKKNTSAILSFTSHSLTKKLADRELQYALNELRRECLVINGMISKMLLLQWPKNSALTEHIVEILSSYQEMTGSACRMCLLSAPELSNKLAKAL